MFSHLVWETFKYILSRVLNGKLNFTIAKTYDIMVKLCLTDFVDIVFVKI